MAEGVAVVLAGAVSAHHQRELLSPAQIRARLDLARPLSTYALDPDDETPEPDPDRATIRLAATSATL